MATALDQSLSCPLCFELFDDPKQLSCGHTMCKNCLDKVYRAQSLPQLTCPMCRHLTPVPEGDLSKLPTNIILKGMSAPYICTANCDTSEQSTVVSFCQTCGEFMCQSCHDLHGKWKKNVNHDVISVDELGGITVRIKQKCKKHPTDMLEYVCKTCRKNVCFKCRVLVCEKAGHDVIEDEKYIRDKRDDTERLSQETSLKIKVIVEHAEFLNQQKQKVKDAVGARRSEIESTFYDVLAELSERKNVLLRTCDNYESALLAKLDKLAEKDKELVETLSNARDLVRNGDKAAVSLGLMMNAHDTLCARLEKLLKTDDPSLSEATAITRRGEKLTFNKKHADLHFAEIQVAEWEHKADVELSKKGEMNGVVPTRGGGMAVGFRSGGIDILSSDCQKQETVLKDVATNCISFMTDGRCVVLNDFDRLSLYTLGWTRLGVRFETLSWDVGGSAGLTVDSDDHIYVSYKKAKKIQVFSTSGGKAVREIPCGELEPFQISVIEPSKMLLVMTRRDVVRVFDQRGRTKHKLIKDYYIFPAACKDGTILIAAINTERDRVSIEQYTSNLKYMRTLIKDHVIEKTARTWYSLSEFKSGEIALSTTDKLHIFHKIVSPSECDCAEVPPPLS